MSDVRFNTGKKVYCLWCTALTVSLFLGLLVSLSDALGVMIHGSPRETALFQHILRPLAPKIVVIIALYMVLWFLLVYLLGRALKLDLASLSVSLAVFMMVAYVLYMAHKMLSFGSLSVNLRIFMLMCGGLLMALVFSCAAYFATKVVSQPKWRALAIAVCLAVPLLLAETIVASWVNKYLLAPGPMQLGVSLKKVFSVPVLAANIIYIVVVVVTLAAFVRIRRGRGPLRVLVVFAVFIFACSALVLIAGASSEMVSKTGVHTGYPIKRVILIVSDALRADALSCYGGRRITTSHIDQLAADGILFKKAFSPAPWTMPSVSSMLTGLSPLVHMATRPELILPDALPTLAEYMRNAGYITQAIGSNPALVLRNFSQGFMGFNFFPKRRDFSPCGRVLSWLFPRRFSGTASTSELTQLAIDWLDSNADNDFFLLVYYYDPHQPYEPPVQYLPDRKPAPGMVACFDAPKSIRGGYLTLTLEQREWVRTLYDSEVRYVDDNVGLLLEHLKKLRIYDDTLIVLASDHGEEFWEHGGLEHGHTLYNELLWVPLIVKLVGSSVKTPVTEWVSTESITPTILELCGIEYERDYMSGGSLIPAWSAPSEVDNAGPIVSTGLLYYEDRISVIFDGLKYIRSLVAGHQEFYDLANDPAERFNIAHLSAEKVEKAEEILERCHKVSGRLKKHYAIEKGEEKKLDAEMRRQLKSLGYVK